MAIPKLALIPSGVKAGKLYSVLPTNGDGDFTTTRNTVATRVNENGLIEEVASNVPRLDYSDGGCPSLLLEPASTNLMPYSEDFSNASWSKTNVTLVSDNGISPEGTSNADLIYPNATDANFTYVYDQVNNASVSQYTISAFVKSSGVNVAWLYIQSVGSVGTVYFDLSDESIQIVNGSSNTLTSEITSLGNGWYRISCTNVTPIALTSGHGIGISDAKGSRAITKNGTNGMLIFGAQLEQNSYATSYIKTVGTIQSRSADTANGAGNASTFNDSEGVLMVEISGLTIGGSTRVISLSGGSQSVNNIYINLNSSGGISCQVLTSGGNNSLSTTNINQEDTNKLLLKYKANDFALWVNGIEADTNATLSSTPTGLNRINFDFGSGSYDFYGNTKQIQYFDSALNDSDLEKLTSWTSFTAMANGQSYTII